ncbi:MAG: helix-turn-helix transcriptional regulator [Bradyrhizobium sp.]|uniref:AraC family transcriptional regulator n=1 Tax=Bradyrhizobium sp. TaxID=376 RepID=UPI001D88756A|nr:helix-turn-helix transcriptional regulator [Bradyrhizobium sp.]MBV9561048.1 helix-turn-helix transcriptional regulator [Bradyrhizobium sp.]
MSVAYLPIAEIRASHRMASDGVHLVARNYRKGVRLDPHMHREAQLVYAARGTMQVTTPQGRWLVPPDRAVWVPARLVHAIDVLADIEMRTLYFDPVWLKRERNSSLRSEFVVRVSPLLHQAILALFEKGNAPERSALLIKLVMLELHRAEDPATFIPLPHEPRCRRAADFVLADLTALHDIERLAQKVGTSARTLSRLFSAETQLSFKAWCQRARIAAAIELMSTCDNVSVKKIAADLGYASMPAFSHAFRQVTGKTPTEFMATQ